MLLIALFACAEEPDSDEVCPDMPESAAEAPNVLTNDDDCGYWHVVIGEELVVDVLVSEVESPCEMETETGLTLLYPPIYTNMNPSGPKWTFQVGADAEASAAGISVACDEGTTWNAQVDVIAGD